MHQASTPSPFPFPGYQWACECLSPVPWGWGIWTMPGCSGKFEPVECVCFKYRGVKRQRVCFCAQMAKKKFEWCLQAKDPILWCQKLICGFPRFCNICDHTKIHSMKNCAWIQHLNATLANGEGRGKSLNAPIFKKLNAQLVAPKGMWKLWLTNNFRIFVWSLLCEFDSKSFMFCN